MIRGNDFYLRAAAAAVILGTALNLAVAAIALAAPPALNSDFLAFWSFPRFAAGHPVAQLYDAAALSAFQQSLYPGFRSFYPYLYPPTLLLATWWLKSFGFAAAQLIWTAAGLFAMSAAGLWMFKARRCFAVLALLASPAALLAGVTGETAFFTSALLLAGFAALPARPWLAGVFFGLLTLKPQLGFLLPFALLGLGAWRTIAAACLTALLLVFVSCLAFPPHLWVTWAQTLPAYQAQYFAAVRALNLNIIVTPAANAVVLGLPPRAAWFLQAACSLALAVTTFLTFRLCPYRLAAAALMAGMFLAVPHAYAYDAIPVTAAIALCMEAAPPRRGFAAAAAVCFLAPLLLLTPASPYFLYAIPDSVLYILLMQLSFAKRPAATT